MAEFLNPKSLWRPFGSFSQIAIGGRDRLAFVKGQVPLNLDGDLVGRGDMAAQVRQVLENLDRAVEALGAGRADILELRIFTTDIDAFMAAAPVRAAFFTAPYPVTTTVEVRRLYDPDILVEIAATVELSGGAG